MALYQLTRGLAQAGTRDEVVWQLVAEVNRVFQAATAVVLPEKKSLAPHPDSSLTLTEKELHVAEWAFLNRQSAGKFTDNLPGAEALHLPLMTERSVVGVLSVSLSEKTLPLARRDLLEAYARQAALVLDRVALRAAGEQSKLVAESERLSKSLLNSISHELRTPLAAITSATAALAESQNAPGGFDPQNGRGNPGGHRAAEPARRQPIGCHKVGLRPRPPKTGLGGRRRPHRHNPAFAAT